MKEQIKIALWNKVKGTYPSGTSKYTNALLEEDFDSFIEEVVKICTIPAVVGRSEQLACLCPRTKYDDCDREMPCKECEGCKYFRQANCH